MPIRNRAARVVSVPAIEPLDPRRLCSATLDHGVLTIEGTRRADAVVVALDGPTTLRVSVNGQQSTFARGAVSRINIFTGLGDDLVGLFKQDAAVAIDAYISAGAGNDNIGSAGGNDTLLGEDGDDVLRGGLGRDRVRGGGGKDRLFGGGGRDLLYGEGSNDYLHGGGGGDDAITGGAGRDTFYRPAMTYGGGWGDQGFCDVGADDAVVDEPASSPIGGYGIGSHQTIIPPIIGTTYGGSGTLVMSSSNHGAGGGLLSGLVPAGTNPVLHIVHDPIPNLPPIVRLSLAR